MSVITDTTAVRLQTRQRFSATNLHQLSILLLPLALFIVLSLASDNFLTPENLKNVLNRSVAVGLIACAGTIVIIAGGFDLSAGAIFAVSSIAGAMVANQYNPLFGIGAGLLVGAGLGLINGLLCSYGRINHFVGTLATMIVFTGLAIAMSGSGLILIKDSGFAAVAKTNILGLQTSSWALLIFALLCSLLLNFTVFGRNAYAVGGNLKAARLSGVSVNGTLILAYLLSGIAAAFAGILTSASSLSVGASSGSNLIWDALAAILIGGNSILGGKGAIWRTLVGVITLSLIANGFNLLGVDPTYQQIVTGAIILVAIAADAWTRKTSG